MIIKVHKALIDFIAGKIADYGIHVKTQFSPELDILSQYTRNLNIRTLLKDVDLLNIDNNGIEELRKESFNYMLYNYSQLKRIEDRLNNIDLELYFKSNDFTNNWNLQNLTQDEILFIKYLRDNNEKLYIRDGLVGKIEYNFKILTSSLSILNDLQILYLTKLFRLKTIYVEINLGENFEPLILEYQINFSEIEDFGYIDYNRYGNIMQLGFACELTGLFLSNYEFNQNALNEINLKVYIKEDNESANN